jgi:voltage-gated potassium channel
MSQRDENELKSMQRRVTIAALLLAGVFIIGVVGYRIIGAPQHGWLDAVYMTTILLTTTGLREVVPTTSLAGEIFTTVLLLFGATAAVYTLSMITAFIVEGDMTQGFRRRRMQKRIDAMHGHFIVCGAGQTGTSVIRELTSTDRMCVAIEHSAQHLAELSNAFPQVATLHGDCSDDETLSRAGVQRAAGIVVCTDDDKNTLVTTVLSRQLNPSIRVVARATSDKAAARLRGAGADGVVSPAQIGGMRLASELVRPSVVGFLDQMLRDTNRNLRLEDISVGAGCALDGQEVSALKLHEYGTGLLLLALRTGDGEYLFNPPAGTRVQPGAQLIVMGDPESVQHLRSDAGRGRAAEVPGSPG